MKFLSIALLLFQSLLQSGNTYAEDLGLIHEFSGSSLAARRFNAAWEILPELLRICSERKGCRFEAPDQQLIHKLSDAIKKEAPAGGGLEFASGRTDPDKFTDPDFATPRIAITGENIGDKIYINSDLIAELQLPQIVTLLIHELGHHHGVFNHQRLDDLGFRFAQFFENWSYDVSAAAFNQDTVRLKIFQAGRNPGDEQLIGSSSNIQRPIIFIEGNDRVFNLTKFTEKFMYCDQAMRVRPTKIWINPGRWLPPEETHSNIGDTTKLQLELNFIFQCDGKNLETDGSIEFAFQPPNPTDVHWWKTPNQPLSPANIAFTVNTWGFRDYAPKNSSKILKILSTASNTQKIENGGLWEINILAKAPAGSHPKSCAGYLSSNRFWGVLSDELQAFKMSKCNLKVRPDGNIDIQIIESFKPTVKSDEYFLNSISILDEDPNAGLIWGESIFRQSVQVSNAQESHSIELVSLGFIDSKNPNELVERIGFKTHADVRDFELVGNVRSPAELRDAGLTLTLINRDPTNGAIQDITATLPIFGKGLAADVPFLLEDMVITYDSTNKLYEFRIKMTLPERFLGFELIGLALENLAIINWDLNHSYQVFDFAKYMVTVGAIK